MKIRNGFVSNSSSSSFILGHGDIGKVAFNMLNILLSDDPDWPSDEDARKWKFNLDVALKLKKVQNGSIGITFPSCNYETYIVKEGDKIYVSTCNNTDWSSVEDECVAYGLGADDESDDECHKRVAEKDFFDLRNGYIHSCEKYFESLQEHPKCPTKDCSGGYSYVVRDGQKICAWCCEGVLGGKKAKVVKTKEISLTNKEIKELCHGLDIASGEEQEIDIDTSNDLRIRLDDLLKQKYDS